MCRDRIALVAPSGKTTFGGEDIDDAIECDGACSDGVQRHLEHETRFLPIEDVGESRKHLCALFVDPADDMVLDS
jgi:hypothetical protein